jgi:membrane protease YdiL (CAAX protease family)
MRRILLVWLVANFALIGIASAFLGSWYLSQPPISAAFLELGLIMLPNLALAVIVARAGAGLGRLHVAWRETLGWTWSGWIIVPVVLGGFGVIRGLNALIGRYIGPSIPYSLPGSSSPIQANSLQQLVGLLLFLLFFVVLTVTGEETMFRGLVQGEAVRRYGPWLGLLVAAVLFGLRHLPADLFYARAWSATPRMWASRQLELYSAGLILGFARRIGRSTYASALVHCLLLLSSLFGI